MLAAPAAPHTPAQTPPFAAGPPPPALLHEPPPAVMHSTTPHGPTTPEATPPPALPTPTAAPTTTSTPPQSVAPASLPDPADAATSTAAGLAATTLAAPFPEPATFAAPILAPPSSEPAVTPPAPVANPGDDPPTKAPKWKRRNRSSRHRAVKIFVVIVLLAGIAAASAYAFRQYAGDVAGDGQAPLEETSGAVGGDPGTLFDEAQELVDDINTNAPGVDEALGALGLDESGTQLPTGADDPIFDGTPAPTPPESYSFRWSDPFGLSVKVQVDSETGDYIAATSDGTEIRRVGERYFGLAANSSWVELSPDVVSGIPVIGIDGVLDDAGIVPTGLDLFVAASEVTADGSIRLLVDDSMLAETDPELRDRWLGPWGLLDTAIPAGTEMPETVPPSASEGQVVVSIAHTADGWVSEVVVSSPAIGGTATYSLSSTALYQLPVEVPVVSAAD